MISHAQLLERVSYDPNTGLFTVRLPTLRRKVGTIMNTNRERIIRPGAAPYRYSKIHVWGLGSLSAGRAAWLYMTGELPPQEVDHHDNDGWNQRWTNLREATRSQNQVNTRRYRSNTSGLKCVFPSGRKARPWRAQIQKDKRRISLGYFDTKEAAFAAVVAASTSYHGNYARPW
jgi:hypothetical protein